MEAEADELAAVLAGPAAPRDLEVDGVGDGSVTVSFLVYDSDPGVQAETTGYEISTNNGSSFATIADADAVRQQRARRHGHRPHQQAGL